MAVYVDDFWRHPAGRLGQKLMSHMIADTEEELHAMAARVGIDRRHYQGDHYDISKRRRGYAIASGAREVTVRQMAAMRAMRRYGWALSPEVALTRFVMMCRAKRRAVMMEGGEGEGGGSNFPAEAPPPPAPQPVPGSGSDCK